MSAAPSANRGSTAPGSTHERFLRIGKTLFATRGYEHTSTSVIARQAGTSESQLMKHFGSKAGLLEAIFHEGWIHITEQARAAIENTISPAEKFQVLSACVLRNIELDPEMKLLMLLEGRRVRKEGHMVLLTEGFLAFVKLLDGVLQEMHAAGLLRPGVDPQAARSALMGMIEGMLRDRYLAGMSAFPAEYDLDQIRQILGLVMDSFTVPSGT